MQTEIDYFAARHFMATSLSELEHNPRVDLAVSAARTEIRALSESEGGPRSKQDWWVPVFYTRSSNLEIYSSDEKRLPEILPAGRQPLPSAPSSAVDVGASLVGLLRPFRGLFSDYERNL